MRKVTTINLNHNAYQIDEDGYEILRRYLEDAAAALARNPDRAEILADLEQAIGDKCRLALGQYRTVVGAEEIGRILREMGPVVGGDADDAAAAAGTGPAVAPGVPPRPRRPYRIREGRFWPGVCNGLAAYFGVDVTWVRVAFVLLTVFTGGFWLIAYLTLIFLMPVATTPEEFAAAHGQPFNAQELVDRFRKKHDSHRAGHGAGRDGNPPGHRCAAQPAASGTAPRPPPGPAARVAGGVMLPVFTVLSAGWFVATALAVYLVWNAGPPGGMHWQFGHWNWEDLPRWIPLVAVVAMYVLLALPIAAGRRTALYYANGGRRHGWADAWAALLWIALVAVALIGAWALMPHLQEVLQNHLGGPPPSWRTVWL